MSTALLEHQARALLEEYGIQNVPGAFCRSREEVSAAAERLGYPVVLKIVSPQVVHKSDLGGVALNLADEESLLTAYDRMLLTVREKAQNAIIEGVLVTKFVSRAREMIVGAVKDKQFGPVVMAGMGGVFVEVFKDISFDIAPVNAREAERMVRSLKSYRILEGVRGERPANIQAVCELIVHVSKLAYERNVEELDINPVFLSGDDVFAGDVRILLSD